MACITYAYVLKSVQVRMGHIEEQCACTAAVVKSQVLIRCDILQQFLHRYIISWEIMYNAVIATAGGHTMY